MNTALVNKATLHSRYRIELSERDVRLVPDRDGFSVTRIAGRGSAQLNVAAWAARSPIPFDNRFLPAVAGEDGAIVATVEDTP